MNDFKKFYEIEGHMIQFSRIVFNDTVRYEDAEVYSEGDYIYVRPKGGKMVIYPKSSLTWAIPSIR